MCICPEKDVAPPWKTRDSARDRNDGPAGMAGENGGSHPDPGRHRTHFYDYYANRVRGDRAALEPGEPTVEEQSAKKRRCSASWARLIMPAAGLCRVARGAACYSLDLMAVRARGRLIR